MITALLIFTAFCASTLSSIFGMAGGLLLLGVYLMVLPVPQVMMLHGLVMLVSNVGRIALHRKLILPSILIMGLVFAPLFAALFLYTAIVLPVGIIYLLVGLTSLIIWIPQKNFRFSLDFKRKDHAALPAFLALGLTLTAGAAGPIIDALFNKAGLTRFQIIVNKALIQFMAHVTKIIVFGGIALITMPGSLASAYSPTLLIGSVLASIAGIFVGTKIVSYLSDASFLKYSRYIITGLAIYYIISGLAHLVK